jgi:hypothetical protein
MGTETGCTATELPLIYKPVDPEILEMFVDSSSEISVSLTFSYHGYTVTVTANREIPLNLSAHSIQIS